MFFERVDENMLCRDYWVFSAEKNIPVRVKEIHSDGILAADDHTYLFDELCGIDVNTDWLQVAGFLRQEDGAFKREGLPFELLQHNYIAVLFNGEEIAGLRFVHELQHFYAGIKQRQLLIDYPPAP